MREGVAESDAGRSGLDELAGILRMEHARLSGHCGDRFYTRGTRKRSFKDVTSLAIREEKRLTTEPSRLTKRGKQ
jgi:hypothetical protein